MTASYIVPEPLPETQEVTVVYHGTSGVRWGRDQSGPDGLSVTVSAEAAKEYARQWEKHGEHATVVAIHLPQFPESSLGPNLGVVKDYADGLWYDLGKPASELTWRDTLTLAGSFVIHGFTQHHKAGTVLTHPALPAPPPRKPVAAQPMP